MLTGKIDILLHFDTQLCSGTIIAEKRTVFNKKMNSFPASSIVLFAKNRIEINICFVHICRDPNFVARVKHENLNIV